MLKDTEIPINVDGSSTEIFMNFDNKTQKGQVYVEKSGEMLSGSKESKTDYGKLYTPVYKENIYLVLRMKSQHVKISLRLKEQYGSIKGML